MGEKFSLRRIANKLVHFELISRLAQVITNSHILTQGQKRTSPSGPNAIHKKGPEDDSKGQDDEKKPETETPTNLVHRRDAP